MKKNIGTIDFTIRIILGVVLVAMVFVGPETPWGWIGLLLIVTGLVKFCPAYVPFKFSTSKQK